MRWLVLALAAVLAVPASAGAQQAWATAYRDGVEAFESGNFSLAEQKLVEARDHPRAPKKQSRRANFSSVDYRPFIPDFYLGVIYARQGRHRQAQEFLERALRDELVKPDDKANYALATSTLQKSRDDQARLASNTARPTPPPEVVRPPANTTPTPTTTPGNPPAQQPTQQPAAPGNATTPPAVRVPPPVTPTEPAWVPRFRNAMDAAQSSLRQSRYAEARGHLTSAESLAGDATRRQEALALRRSIDAAQSVEALRVADQARAAVRAKDLDAAQNAVARLETVSPGHTAIAGIRTDVERLRGSLQGAARLASLERLGVKLFLSGNYKESADELERAVGSGVTSPRIYLFLASSRAAQALLAPQAERQALVAEARRHYALAKPGAAALAADQRFISASILQVLTGS